MNIRIIDIAGRLIVDMNLREAQITGPMSIDLSPHPNGIYFLQCIKGDEILLKKKLVKI